jgi:hypothetical protein
MKLSDHSVRALQLPLVAAKKRKAERMPEWKRAALRPTARRRAVPRPRGAANRGGL